MNLRVHRGCGHEIYGTVANLLLVFLLRQHADTIPGRQCMASCFFLMKQFDDVLLYLSSIKSYFFADDAFNFNYGQAKAVTGCFAEAEEALEAIKEEKLQSDPVYVSWLIRCCEFRFSSSASKSYGRQPVKVNFL